MKSILALSLAPLGAGWAFGIPGDRPMSGFMTFGSNSHTDDELFRNAQTEIINSISANRPAIVAMTADASGSKNAQRLYDLHIVIRTNTKALLPGAAKKVDIADALECFTGVDRFPFKAEADRSAMLEACRRGWLDVTTLTADRALALSVWTHMAAQQLPELAFHQPRKARA